MLGDRDDLTTEWVYFDYPEAKITAELLARTHERPADVLVTLEPVTDRRSGLFRRRGANAHRVTVCPHPDDSPAHWLLRFTFPPGRAFLQRAGVLPLDAQVVANGTAEATVRIPIGADPGEVAAAVLELARRCAENADAAGGGTDTATAATDTAAADSGTAGVTGQWRIMVTDLRHSA